MSKPLNSLNNILFILTILSGNVLSEETEVTDFSPYVTASCKSGYMNINVQFHSPYYGAIHVRDFRKNDCMVIGNGSNISNLNLNLLSKQGQSDFCGVLVTNKSQENSEERSIQLAVRVHKSLELAEDKFFIITCGKSENFRKENAITFLTFYDKDMQPVREAVYGHSYVIKAESKLLNGSLGINVKNCFAFDKANNKNSLIDDRGCPVNSDIISSFKSNSDGISATATLKSMFKFPERSEVHLQCDIVNCENNCSSFGSNCDNVAKAGFSESERNMEINTEKKQLATTTVFVIDPSENKLVSSICESSGVHPSWLLWLTISFGVLFVIMLLMNIFLCTAMNCSWTRTEIIEKEPSIIEEYDPYRSWHGSQYGSRYSLHGRDSHNRGYNSGGSTIHSNRSDRY